MASRLRWNVSAEGSAIGAEIVDMPVDVTSAAAVALTHGGSFWMELGSVGILGGEERRGASERVAMLVSAKNQVLRRRHLSDASFACAADGVCVV